MLKAKNGKLIIFHLTLPVKDSVDRNKSKMTNYYKETTSYTIQQV
jgi:hypothetical protein